MTETQSAGRIRSALAGDPGFSESSLDGLTVAALAYLGLPLLIFFLTWLVPIAALCFVAASALVIYSLAPRFRRTWQRRPSIAGIAIVIAVSLGWSMLGGGSHYVYANPDWLVRDSVLGDLTYSPWPPSYRLEGGVHYVLRSAIGFFLPVAMAGKLLGPEVLPHLMFAWTALGVAIFLLLLPLPRVSGAPLLGALAIIIGFSGMDILGILLVHGHYPVFPLRLEWWSEFAFRAQFSYSSLMGQLVWAPNHALAMWIGTALIYRHWKHPDFTCLLCLLVPVLPLVSPFALPGMLAFALYAVLGYRWQNQRFPSVPLVAIISAGIVLVLLARLQTLDVGSIVVAASGAGPAIAVPATDPLAFVRNYLVFVIMEFALLALVLFRLLDHSRGIFLVATATLLALPLFSLGPSNDLLLRVSTPSLVILAILAMRVLTSGETGWSRRHVVLVSILLIGAHTPFNEAARAVLWSAWKPDYTRTLVDVQQGYLPHHYVARLNDPILAKILRTPGLVPSREQRR